MARKLRQENNFSGGVNSGTSLFDVHDNESSDEFGFDTDNHPVTTVRKGRSLFGASGAAITRLLTNYQHTKLVRAVGTVLQYYDGSAWVNIATGLTNADWDSTNFNDKLLLTNGTDNVKQLSVTVLTDLNAVNAPKGKYITNDTVRVWIAIGDKLHWSKYLDETDWTATENAGSVQYYTANGGDITALRRFYDRVTVFKKDAMSEVQGRNFFNFQLVEVSNDIGCVSFKTLQEVGDTLMWLGERDVYGYQGGKPSPIGGLRIKGYISRINQTYVDKCCAFTDGDRYYLCLVIDAATEPNLRLVYDPRHGIWRVPAKDESYRYGALYNNVVYVGDSSGQTWKPVDGETDNGTAIPWQLDSKVFDEGYPEAEKTYMEMHLQGEFPTGTTLNVAVSTVDNGAVYTTIDYDPTTAAAATQNKNLIVPMDTVPLANFFRYRLSGTGRVKINQAQRYFRTAAVQR